MSTLKFGVTISIILFCNTISVENAFVKPPVQNVAAQCFDTQTGFETFCQQQLYGVKNGGRCYFVAATSGGWNSAWAACRAYGATLAQVHTSSEYKSISDYLRVVFGVGYLCTVLSLSDQQTGGQPCKLFANSTFWYSSETEKILNLPIEKGYLYRYHRCDGIDGGDEAAPRCVIFLQYDGSKPLMGIGDWLCEAPASFNALCEFTNSAQDYVKSIDKCLGEDPTETTEGQNENDCAILCSHRQWCRSFNFIEDGQCELFTWSILDTNVTKINDQCHHYNYVE